MAKMDGTKVERPILFSGEMVRAILEGRKSQTRRVANVRGADRVIYVDGAKLVPEREGDEGFTGWVAEVDKLGGAKGLHLPLKCPYGKAGDSLWVRETFVLENTSEYHGEHEVPAEGTPIEKHEEVDGDGNYWLIPHYRATEPDAMICEDPDLGTKWKPSIFMPRWASRINLGITHVRVERIQEISGMDCIAEGVTESGNSSDGEWRARETFKGRWDNLNKKRGFGWETNCWVWVIEFKKHAGEIANA